MSEQQTERQHTVNNGATSPTQLQSNGDSEAALGRHAAEMEKAYAAPDLSGPCQLCGARPPKWQVELEWGAVYNTTGDLLGSAVGLAALLAVGHGKTFYHKSRFNTYHACCGACYRRLMSKWLVAGVAEKLCFGLLIMGLLAAVASLVYGTVLVTSHPSRQEKVAFSLALGLAVAGLALGFLLPKALRRWGTPNALRTVGLWPYALERSRRSRL
jgi:hypothetical protein